MHKQTTSSGKAPDGSPKLENANQRFAVSLISDSHSSFLAGFLLIRGLLPADAVSVRQAVNLRSAYAERQHSCCCSAQAGDAGVNGLALALGIALLLKRKA